MKLFKILSVTACLFLGVMGYAQIYTNGDLQNTHASQNVVIDASEFSSDSNNYGRGLVFPRTDLTTFTFKATDLDGIFLPTAFDGMVVYNTGTGKTVADNGAVGDVIPGFY